MTVIVPTFNRPKELAGCLRSLTTLAYPRDAYEIIVVDDGGTSDLARVVEKLGDTGVEVRLLRQHNQGPGAARNFGAREARGHWLAFTDDDCVPRPDWLAAFRRVLERNGDALVGGRTLNGLSSNPYSCTSQLIVDAAYRFFNPDPLNGRFVASNNIGIARTAFLAAGGFDETFRIASEDREFCDRWRWRGGRIVYATEPVIEHLHDLKLGTFLDQHYRYGRGAARFHQVRSARGTGAVWGDVSFRWQWRELVWTPALSTARPASTLALLVCWQLANTAGFIRDFLPTAISGQKE